MSVHNERTTDTIDAYRNATGLLLAVANAAAKRRHATTLEARARWGRALDDALDAWLAAQPSTDSAKLMKPE